MRFILIDEILEMEPGRSVKAVKTLPASEELFQDHFPGFPVVPGVLLTEMMAQAAGKCLNAEPGRKDLAMLAKIKDAAFNAWVRPDELALIHARITKNRPTFAEAECHIEVADKKVCSACLFFAFANRSTLAADYRDPVLERFLEQSAAP